MRVACSFDHYVGMESSILGFSVDSLAVSCLRKRLSRLTEAMPFSWSGLEDSGERPESQQPVLETQWGKLSCKSWLSDGHEQAAHSHSWIGLYWSLSGDGDKPVPSVQQPLSVVHCKPPKRTVSGEQPHLLHGLVFLLSAILSSLFSSSLEWQQPISEWQWGKRSGLSDLSSVHEQSEQEGLLSWVSVLCCDDPAS